MSMHTQAVTNDTEFEAALNAQVNRGFVITHRSDGAATLQRPQKIPPAAWLLILIPGAGWLALLAIFLVKKSRTDVVEIKRTK